MQRRKNICAQLFVYCNYFFSFQCREELQLNAVLSYFNVISIGINALTFFRVFRLFNANVKQVINVSQIFAKKMIEERIRGAIVNVSSQVQPDYSLRDLQSCGPHLG